MRFVCWINKATDTHSEYVILVAFPLQQWLYERASMLSCTYNALFFSSCFWLLTQYVNKQQLLLSLFLFNICNEYYFVLFPWTSNSISRSHRLRRDFYHLLPISLLHPAVHRLCISWKQACLLTSYINSCISTINSFVCVDYILFYCCDVRCQTPIKHTTKYLWITTSNFSQAQLCTPWWWIT
jgi:hypothetical protein